MKSIILIIILSNISLISYAKKIELPKISIEKAIEIARKYAVKKYKISPKKYILLEVEYRDTYNEYSKAYWEVKWVKYPRAKGGWFIVKVFNDSTAVMEYGE